MKKIYLFILFAFINSILFGQNTIGTLLNSEDSYNGYTLFTAKTETYLINNCGEVVNQWSSSYPPGNTVSILENGNLLRPGKIGNPDITFGGTGGIIELFDWEGNLLWQYDYSTNLAIQHHEVFPLPNGNILMLAVSTLDQAAAVQAGRNPANLADGQLYNEQILELEPIGTNAANIVWEWNIKDHLIQDFDSSKDNFGIISDNPQLLDINFLGSSASKANWMHINSMQYYENLDQIVLSSRQLNEIYIIDHSTTTAQAASNFGGTYNSGGDILYRWGNPQAYGQGTVNDQKLFGQHYPHFIPDGLNDAGKILLFNNGFNRTPQFSEVSVLTPPTTAPGVYAYSSGTAYGPTSTDYTYTDPVDPGNFFSSFLSSAQRLPNGNTLICEGASGHFFEIDAAENIVWEYINPVGTLEILTQGDDPTFSANTTFRLIRYAPDYVGFNGKDLSPGNPIELNPDLSACTILGIVEDELTDLKIFPNPVNDLLRVEAKEEITNIEIYGILGKKLSTVKNQNTIDVKILASGVYFVKLYSFDKISTRKFIKSNKMKFLLNYYLNM